MTNKINYDLSGLYYILRSIDGAMAELEAAVADGDVDEVVLIELDTAHSMVQDMIKEHTY